MSAETLRRPHEPLAAAALIYAGIAVCALAGHLLKEKPHV